MWRFTQLKLMSNEPCGKPLPLQGEGWDGDGFDGSLTTPHPHLSPPLEGEESLIIFEPRHLALS
jgi:hypothetical protein